MSVTMAYGMEVFNVAVKEGFTPATVMPASVFRDALYEASFMCLFVFLFSNLWGNRIGQALAKRIVMEEKDNPFFIIVVTSSCTVLVMCPTMSLVASLLFTIFPGRAPSSQLPAVWAGTILKNFPMALLWNLFAAGPLSRLVLKTICKRKGDSTAT